MCCCFIHSSCIVSTSKAADGCHSSRLIITEVRSGCSSVEKGKYQNAPECSFRGGKPQEAWDQSCTSVIVWLVFSLLSLLASEHRWRFICCLFPLDSFSFSIPILLPPNTPPSLPSRACLPAEALYLTVRLSDSLSFSCGRRPPSVAVTANRHAEGLFQAVI